nr:regulatory iron-sulfur-containing complex subunit RicT [Bacteroidales bacterium]
MSNPQADYNNPFFTRGCRHEPTTDTSKAQHYCHGCSKLADLNYMDSIPIPPGYVLFDCCEVRFKNSKKGFFKIPPELDIELGDIVAVESTPGHDIGIVSLVGETARLQMEARKITTSDESIRKIYRKARPADIEKWVSSVTREKEALVKTRQIASELTLDMKVNDIEFQGDGTKATFYYTADERVDFRELIKVLAEQFKVRIEMKQIGIRQEAARVGGLGSCGRELCCSTWLTRFRSVSTHAARVQQLSSNPQKLAGQCGKLKCCLNYEVDAYVDAMKEFPTGDIVLKTRKGLANCNKIDVFKRLLWFNYLEAPGTFVSLDLDVVKEIIKRNKRNEIPDDLESFDVNVETKPSPS